MDEIGGKIISVVIGAVIIFALQAFGVHKIVANIIGGGVGVISEDFLENESSGEVEMAHWRFVEKCGTKKCYQSYLDEYPQGQFASLARLNIEQVKEDHKDTGLGDILRHKYLF